MTINIKYNQQKKLIIGCGNNYKNHQHPENEYYTIDEHSFMKPSLICSIGKEEINLPDNSFNLIIFEGLFPIAINTFLGISEIQRISQERVTIKATYIENGKDMIMSERKNISKKFINKYLLRKMTKDCHKFISNLD